MPAMPMNAKCSCGAIIIWGDETTTSETLVFCEACGQKLGTYGDLERRITQTLRDRIEGLFGVRE